MINVTKTYLPNIKKLKKYIDQIYQNSWVTNNGPLVQELESRLAKFLGVENIVLVSNGTVALEIAYRALDIKEYAITTPFSFVATTSSLVTNNIRPIFADIDPNTFNIMPCSIEQCITPNTQAIVPVHVFGNACEVESIQDIANHHGLKVIYDAAHAFGVNYKGQSLLNHGDISTLSFHATKLFHSIEGGAIIVNDNSLVEKVRHLINFGISGPDKISHLGTNAKMNEFEAAMGLCVLDEIEKIHEQRKNVVDRYEAFLSNDVKFQLKNEFSSENYSYFPVLFKSESQLLKVVADLNENNIFPRRYFYPSLDTLDYIEPKQYCENSRNISCRVLCLPLFPSLEQDKQMKIINIIKTNC